MYKTDKNRPSPEQTLILNERSELSQSGRGMPFTVSAHALIISALIYPCAFVRAWGQNIILTQSQNMQSVPWKCLVRPLNEKQT